MKLHNNEMSVINVINSETKK